MTKYTSFIAVSKDGFIADENGNVDFLEDSSLKIKDDGGYKSYFKKIDGLVYGSSTYKIIKNFKLKKWPYSKPQWVLTSKPESFEKTKNIKFINTLIKKLNKKITFEHIWVMGGANVIGQYIKLDILDEITICYLNKNLHKGIKLFPDGFPQNFKNIREEKFGDLTNITYKRIKTQNH